MPVQTKLDIKGPGLVFITTTVRDWLPVFNNVALAEVTISQLAESIRHFHVSLVGYVLMPSHLHLLAGFQHVEKLSRFMQSFKILSSKRIKTLQLGDYLDHFRVHGKFRFWQPRYDDLLITSEKQFKIKLEYIHSNPVRAGLVSEASQRAFSSASDWYLGKRGLIEIDKEFGWTR